MVQLACDDGILPTVTVAKLQHSALSRASIYYNLLIHTRSTCCIQFCISSVCLLGAFVGILIPQFHHSLGLSLFSGRSHLFATSYAFLLLLLLLRIKSGCKSITVNYEHFSISLSLNCLSCFFVHCPLLQTTFFDQSNQVNRFAFPSTDSECQQRKNECGNKTGWFFSDINDERRILLNSDSLERPVRFLFYWPTFSLHCHWLRRIEWSETKRHPHEVFTEIYLDEVNTKYEEKTRVFHASDRWEGEVYMFPMIFDQSHYR